MLESLINNLTSVAIAMGLYVCIVIANICLGLYNNVKVLKQPFDKTKIIDSVIRMLCVAIGTALLVIVVTITPLFCQEVGFTIPDEYVEVFSNLAIISITLWPVCVYVKDAYSKLSVILKNDNKEASADANN